MVEFVYNNAKNASASYTSFELNYKYYPYISYEKNLNSHSKSKTIEELFFELQNFIAICQQNLYHAQKYWKQAYNKRVKPQNYALDNKVWISSKYFKIKQNCKLEAKFLSLFQVLHPVNKQTYKLKLPKK